MNILQDTSSKFLSTQIYSQQNSQLQTSRLSQSQIDQMSMQNLLKKLLQLYQTLNGTENQNEFLRIQKAQLRKQLIVIKSNATAYIHNNLRENSAKQYKSFNNHKNLSNHSPNNQQKQEILSTLQQNGEQYSYNIHHNANMNNNFYKKHTNEQKYHHRFSQAQKQKRIISNNCIPKNMGTPKDYRKQYKSTLNSPAGVQSPSINPSDMFQEIKNMNNKKKYNKIDYPYQEIENLIWKEREYEQENSQSQNQNSYQYNENNCKEIEENQMLENFQSFYRPNYQQNQHNIQQNQQYKQKYSYSQHRQQDRNPIRRNIQHSNSTSVMNKQSIKNPNNNNKNTISTLRHLETIISHKNKQKIHALSFQYPNNLDLQLRPTNLNLHNDDFFNEDFQHNDTYNNKANGFSIPCSIDDIWNTDKKRNKSIHTKYENLPVSIMMKSNSQLSIVQKRVSYLNLKQNDLSLLVLNSKKIN